MVIASPLPPSLSLSLFLVCNNKNELSSTTENNRPEMMVAKFAAFFSQCVLRSVAFSQQRDCSRYLKAHSHEMQVLEQRGCGTAVKTCY